MLNYLKNLCFNLKYLWYNTFPLFLNLATYLLPTHLLLQTNKDILESNFLFRILWAFQRCAHFFKVTFRSKVIFKNDSSSKISFKKWPNYVIQSAMCWGEKSLWYKYFSTCYKVIPITYLPPEGWLPFKLFFI